MITHEGYELYNTFTETIEDRERLTPGEASSRNAQLATQQSDCRWIPAVETKTRAAASAGEPTPSSPPPD